MLAVIRLIIVVIRAIYRATIPTKPSLQYERGIDKYGKAYFDEYYPFQFYKYPLQSMPDNISYYDSKIKRMTLFRKNSATEFEIYETKVISDKELAMNVRASYADFVQTGITSKKHSITTQNQMFVLCIDNKMNQLEIKSSIEANITEKNIKKDFGDYLVKYLLKITE